MDLPAGLTMDENVTQSILLEHEGRLSKSEQAITTLSQAAYNQIEFIKTVVGFMSSVRKWGIVALMVYSLGQALLIAKL